MRRANRTPRAMCGVCFMSRVYGGSQAQFLQPSLAKRTQQRGDALPKVTLVAHRCALVDELGEGRMEGGKRRERAESGGRMEGRNGEGGKELSRLPVQHQTGCCFTAAAVVDERAALRVSKAYSAAARAMRIFVHENASQTKAKIAEHHRHRDDCC
jgi:hypothetical protein